MMTMTRGRIADGKRQTNWKVRPDVLDWLDAEARRLGLANVTACANYMLARLRTNHVFYADAFEGEPNKGQRPKRTHTSWRILEENCRWLEGLAAHLKDPRGKRLRTMPAVANYLLARCMNGEVNIQE